MAYRVKEPGGIFYDATTQALIDHAPMMPINRRSMVCGLDYLLRTNERAGLAVDTGRLVVVRRLERKKEGR